MLSIFRIFDLSRIIILAIILIVIRLPFWIQGVPLLKTVFEFQILGEALANQRLIYAQVWHYCAPFSAIFFQMMGETVGRSFIFYQILGFIFLFVQALYFNNILNRLDALKDRTLVPSLFYIFFGSLFIEQFSVSPELLVLFPLLYILDQTLQQIRFGAESYRFFLIGLALSFAFLFDSTSIWLLPFLIIYYPFVFVMTGRRFALLVSGWAFPILAVLVYFFLRSAHTDFVNLFLYKIFDPFDISYFNPRQFVLFFSIPSIFFLIGIYHSIFRARFLNFQASFGYFFLFLTLGIFPIVFFAKGLSVKSFYLMIPIWVFFSSHLYLLLKRRSINELIFTLLLILTVLVNYGFTYKVIFNPKIINVDPLLVRVNSEESNKTISILDKNLGAWYENHYAGPFFYYPYTQEHFKNGLTLKDIAVLHALIESENPDIILDTKGYFGKLKSKDILLDRKYGLRDLNSFVRLD